MKEYDGTCLPGCQNGCPQLNVKLSSINPGLTSLKWSHLFVFNVCLLPWTKSLISFSPFWVKSLFTYFKRSHFPNVSSFASFGPYFAHLLPQSVLFGHFSWPVLLEDTSSSSSQGPDLLLKDELLDELLLLSFHLGQSGVLGGEPTIWRECKHFFCENCFRGFSFSFWWHLSNSLFFSTMRARNCSCWASRCLA